MKSDEHENWYTETDFDSVEHVVLIRMPQTMYERPHRHVPICCPVAAGDILLPRFPKPLVLNAYIHQDGDGVRVLPD